MWCSFPTKHGRQLYVSGSVMIHCFLFQVSVPTTVYLSAACTTVFLSIHPSFPLCTHCGYLSSHPPPPALLSPSSTSGLLSPAFQRPGVCVVVCLVFSAPPSHTHTPAHTHTNKQIDAIARSSGAFQAWLKLTGVKCLVDPPAAPPRLPVAGDPKEGVLKFW